MNRSLLLLITLGFSFSSQAVEPLHQRIDALIEAKAKSEAIRLSPIADDAEFLRRVSLDFTGCIPTADHAKAFLDNRDPKKREKLIDTLLSGPDFAGHMANVMQVHLMERLGEHEGWHNYLKQSFVQNKPWDQLVREMLRADATDPKTQAAGFFLSKRLENYGQNPVDYSALTRDVGRLFLGKNFQCNECHDHLFVDDYKQKDFQGLHAFFKNTVLIDAKAPTVGEKPTTEKTSFVSVFTKIEMTTAPALPNGRMVEIPVYAKGMEYLTPPGKGNRYGVPKFSTLKAISEQLPVKTNRDFVRNGANRLWFLMLGRGLVHPLDMHHPGNDPSHPELLDALSEEFASHQFDIRYLLREIALSRTYQRSSRLPEGATDPAPEKFFTTAVEKRMSAEQLFDSVQVATGSKFDDSVEKKFLKAYANQPREPEEEVAPSLKSALFLSHDSSILALTQPKAGNLVDRLGKLPTPQAKAEQVYLAVLSRRPTAEETATVTKFLAGHPGEVGTIVWALLASMEFGVNH